jgi:CRP-like cAMP-binding protein
MGSDEKDTTSDRRGFLKKVPMFSCFVDEEIDWLAACAHERPMRRGETLMRAGDPGLSIMVIILGEAHVMLASAAGRAQIINTLGRGSVFGEIALFDGKPRTADIIAATNGRLLVIERAAVQNLMERNPRLALRVIEVLCARLRSTTNRLDALLFQDVTTRLAINLLSLAHGPPPRRLDITQAAFGQLVGASREIVNKRLRALEAEGIVSLSPGRIVLLDEARLIQAAQDRSAAV